LFARVVERAEFFERKVLVTAARCSVVGVMMLEQNDELESQPALHAA